MHKKFPRRAIHLDFHTMPAVPDVGRDFDPEAFAGTLAGAGVEYVTAFARCNLGFAYYPTRVGIPHPGLRVPDMLGPMVRACHQRKIAVAAYFNAGLDHEHAVLHREWVKVSADGRVYDTPKQDHFFRKMCLNTGYGAHLLAMVREVLTRYPVDGIFLDCITLDPCYGVECLDGMRRAGVPIDDPAAARRYCWRVTRAFADRVRALARALRKDVYLYFNGLPYATQPTHLELEILPNGEWGYDTLPAHIRYVRTLGKPFFMMTGRFHKTWCDFGGVRSEHSLLFDCYNALANGGGCSVGDHMHPRGRLEPAVYDLVGRVFRRMRALDEWTDGARAQTEVAVLFPQFRQLPGQPEKVPPAAWQSAQGAARMLMELKQQFDFVDGVGDWSNYKVLILPDDLAMTPELRRKLAAHIRCGGAVLSSAFAGLDARRGKFALPGWPAVFAGLETHAPTFFEALAPVAADVPRMPCTIYTPGIAMRAAPGAKTLARLWRSYFNHAAWDGRHEHLYTPPAERLPRPALVRRGNLFHCAFPIFGGYRRDAMPAYKCLVRNCLALALPRPLLAVAGLPSFGQATLTGQGRRRMAHLLTYLPELRGEGVQVIEEPVCVRDVELALRCERGRPVRRVYAAPGRTALDWRMEDGYAKVRVPEVHGHQMVVFE